MTSKKAEDVHVILLNKILSESGLECSRSGPESLESSSSSGESEEQALESMDSEKSIGSRPKLRPSEIIVPPSRPTRLFYPGPRLEEEEARPEALHEEEEKLQQAEEIPEELPFVFPTPSLRKILPDRIRKIEEQNRIHVLPEEFRTDIDPALIPKIAITAQQKYIDVLAEMVGCTKYKSSLAEFWFLDTLANLLRRAQEDEMNRPTQAVLIVWFCEWMKEMQHFDAADRQRMLRRFKDNMLAAARYIAAEDRLPTPTEAGVDYKAPEELPEGQEPSPTVPVESKHLVTFEGAAYECSLMDLTKIIHYIFDLFSSDYQYNLVRSVFTFTPDYVLIDTPYQLQNPKRLFAPLKAKPKKEKSPKKEVKGAPKGKKREPDTEEYLALMELKAKEERELDEQEDIDREAWHRRRHVLPLSFAADDALFDKYWPPPPEPEPEPIPEPKAKPKGKGKK